MGLALILAAGMIVYLARHDVETNSRQRLIDHAHFASSMVLPKMLAPDDWKKVITLDVLLKHYDAGTARLLTTNEMRARLFSPDGTVIFSSSDDMAGSKSEFPQLVSAAMSGRTVSKVTRMKNPKSGESERVVVAFAPVVYPGSSKPVGVLGLFKNYSQAAGSIRNQALPLTAGIILVFLLLYLALLPVLRRTTKALSATNDELRHRAEDLNENLIERAAIEQRLRETISNLERSETALAHSQEETILRLSMAVESRDQETGDHIERMGRYCELLAQKIGWSETRCELLRIAAPLHDVGKIGIPDSILLKPGKLTAEERVEIERHAEIGHNILAGSESPLLDLAARIALSHHEHWDGGGYPNGLAGEQIPVEGRMAAIADVFDALTSDRVYRAAMPVEQALSIMSEGRETHFDPALLDVFFDSIVEVLMIRDGRENEAPDDAESATAAPPRKTAATRQSSAFSTAGQDGEQQRSMVG